MYFIDRVRRIGVICRALNVVLIPSTWFSENFLVEYCSLLVSLLTVFVVVAVSLSLSKFRGTCKVNTEGSSSTTLVQMQD